jgi:hypothetical protein
MANILRESRQQTAALAGTGPALLPGMDQETVCDLLADDHAHLEDRVRALREPLEAGDLLAAASDAQMLAADLLEHMRQEDELLFPLFASRLLMVRPTSVLAREHRRIAAQLRDLREAIDAGELLVARRNCDDLLALLELHHRRELEGLYSWADLLLGGEVRGRLVQKLRDRKEHTA